MNTGITAFLKNHSEEHPVWFHMPGHKGEDLFIESGYGDFVSHIINGDITEIDGADNLFQTEGIILETMEKYKTLYNVRKSYLLINGSSAGLIAGIMSSVKRGHKLIMARNCHKSVFNGLKLAGAEPVYLYPEKIEDFGISGEISPVEVRRALEEHPDSDAVIITSPNYYGICSDIRSIAEEVHKKGKILIVDQAHGAHLGLFEKYIGGRKLSAESQGADIVINSTHKTLASFTQTAIANICTDRTNLNLFEDRLQMIESTSPSYLLMSSLDMNASILEKRGGELIKQWNDNLDYFYKEAGEIAGLAVLKDPMLDKTKLNLDMSAYGIDGLELEKLLIRENIYVELVTGNILMCMTGIGNKRCDYEKLITALKKIASEHEQREGLKKEGKQVLALKKTEQKPVPHNVEYVPVCEAAGRVCGASVIPYPPGIPIICPGEVMDEEILNYVSELRAKGEKVMGIDEKGRVVAGIEE